MRTVIDIAGVNLRRLVRDRVGLFFVFVFPIILILLLGVTFGGDFSATVGVVAPDGELSDALVDGLHEGDGVDSESYATRNELVDAVERGLVDAGVVVPEDYEETIASGDAAEIGYIARAGDFSTALRSTVESAVARQSALVRAARFAESETETDFETGLRQARLVAAAAPTVEVDAGVAGGSETSEGRFDLGAATQLVLFTFVNSLAGAVALVQTRKLGVSQRMLSTPMRAGTLVMGEAAGRFSLAMVQGVFIIVAAAIVFGVRWGDPIGAAALIIAFGLVSTGAALFFGAILSNEQQAGALTPVGLALAALGGCMVPLEVFSPTMQAIAHVTPHAWAVEGFTELIRRDAGLVDVLPQVGVLLAFATVLLALASWRLRRSVLG
ncbi:MAG: ABC transporter permease [Actinomycetota bacterium]